MARDLPRELREAIERQVQEITPRELARATEELSAQLRSPTRLASPVVRSRPQVLAYAAYRVPATYAAAPAQTSVSSEAYDEAALFSWMAGSSPATTEDRMLTPPKRAL